MENDQLTNIFACEELFQLRQQGVILYQLEKYQEAIIQQKAVLERIRLYNWGHDWEQKLLNDLSMSYKAQGQLELAIECLAEVYQQQAVENPLSLMCATTLFKMGKLWAKHKDVVQAIECYQRVVDIYEVHQVSKKDLYKIHVKLSNLNYLLGNKNASNLHLLKAKKIIEPEEDKVAKMGCCLMRSKSRSRSRFGF